ncbi:hypothetical protein ACIHCQ_23840 [Streptomyces sp. NPDC052236]|uniref:hypothetical protein n=1 Tax=Streptomyces sp. NPDC052236 TaxID=3365686 RepID=UPI0037D4465C
MQRFDHARGIRECLGRDDRLSTPLMQGVMRRLKHHSRRSGRDQQQDDHDLEKEHLPGDTAQVQQGLATITRPPGERMMRRLPI